MHMHSHRETVDRPTNRHVPQIDRLDRKWDMMYDMARRRSWCGIGGGLGGSEISCIL